MASISCEINGKQITLSDIDPEMPVLWVLRDILGLTGTKYGCGRALCGACTIHVNGNPVRSCTMKADMMEGRSIRTIEGLAVNGLHYVQKAWIEANVPQCGYCQAGQIMSAVALLEENPNPSDREINMAMSVNLCRCGTYNRIREAIRMAAGKGGNS